MRKDYDHLKPQQRRLLERGVEIIRTQFAESIKGKAWERQKQGRILKIVLYGSMARGKAVRDLSSGYRSDFDLLIVVSHKELAEDHWWYGAEDGLNFEESLGATRYPYNIVVHDIADVNDQLRRGRPFFVDINRDGIIVYEFDTKALAKPGNLSAAEIHEEARGHFEQWFQRSLAFAKGARFYVGENELNLAAFSLHQAVESAYHCLLLTLTLYSPQLHNIKKLRSMAEGLDQRLIEAWPPKNPPPTPPLRPHPPRLCRGAIFQALPHHEGNAGRSDGECRDVADDCEDGLRGAACAIGNAGDHKDSTYSQDFAGATKSSD